MLWGTEGSLEISSQILRNLATSSVFTQALILSQSAWNWFVTKWVWIACSMCHVQRKIQLCGYTNLSAAICAWSWSVIITLGQTDGLASLTHLTKNEMISVIPLDVSIQATGTPISEMLALLKNINHLSLPCPQWSLATIVNNNRSWYRVVLWVASIPINPLLRCQKVSNWKLVWMHSTKASSGNLESIGARSCLSL